MVVLNIILLVLFVVACVLIVFLVLLQNEEGDSIGGLFAGGSNSAFGSKSGNVLTKATYVLVTIFFVSSFLLAFLNRTSYGSIQGVQEEGQKIQNEGAEPWYDTETKVENKEEAAMPEETSTENSPSTDDPSSAEQSPSDENSSTEPTIPNETPSATGEVTSDESTKAE